MNRFRYLFVGAALLHLLTLFFDVGTQYCLAIAPLALGALAAAGGAAMNSIANEQNKSNAQYSLAMQKDLLDYQWKNFNSPKAQVDSLVKAGLNPSVAFGQGGMRGIAPSGQAPQLAQSDIGLSGQDMANTILALSQAKKAGLDSEATQLSNRLFKDTYKEQVEKIGLENNWSKENIAKVQQEIGLMSGQFNELQQRIENMRSEKALTDKSVDWFDRHMKAEINHLRASADYQDSLKGLTDSQKELLDRTLEDLCDITSYQSQQMEKIVDLLGKYGDAQAIVGMLSQVVGSASDLIGTITNFKNAGKVVETITGSTTQKSDGSWTTTNSRTTRK